MKEKFKVLVTGATGKSGSIAIQEVLKMGFPVRALVHGEDERSENLAALGADVMIGDLLSFDDISAAMEGIGSAYFCFPILTPGVLQSTAYFAQAAVEAGIGAIVNMSQVSARRDAKSNAAQDHWVGERILDMTGIPTTHLRPTFFDDWFLYVRDEIRERNRIVLPFGHGRWAPIDTGDLGRVVARILTNPVKYSGMTIKLYGPEEYDVFQMSSILSSVLGRTIHYDPVTIQQFTEMDAQRGAHEHFIQHVTHVAQDCIDGVFSGTNDWVELITGRKPSTLAEYFTSKKQLFE